MAGDRPQSRLTTLSIAEIRVGSDMVAMNPSHVLTLAESIAALGVTEPLIVDRNHYLLSGVHRLAALQILSFADAEDRVDALVASLGGDHEGVTEDALGDPADRVRRLQVHDFLEFYP